MYDLEPVTISPRSNCNHENQTKRQIGELKGIGFALFIQLLYLS